ncbi:MAG: FAD-dependent thymidylate synthase [Nitrososphaerales archaeon]|nr:FAD-dependent thymidylate synthase [Nitrososphaerales archaeon]
MKVSLVWSSPSPEKTIAVAMRRCYSTKPIEEIESELEQKGPDYWKYLLTKALQDKSLDVIEHFTMTLLVEGVREVETGELVRGFPYLRFLRLGGDSWLLTMNGRTLIELWRNESSKLFAGAVVSELDERGVCPLLIPLAFGERVSAS